MAHQRQGGNVDKANIELSYWERKVTLEALEQHIRVLNGKIKRQPDSKLVASWRNAISTCTRVHRTISAAMPNYR